MPDRPTATEQARATIGGLERAIRDLIARAAELRRLAPRDPDADAPACRCASER